MAPFTDPGEVAIRVGIVIVIVMAMAEAITL